MDSRGLIVCLFGASLAPALAGCEDTAYALQRGAPPAIVLSDVRLETYGPEGSTSVTVADQVTYRRDTGELEGETVVLELPDTERVGRGGAVISAPLARGDVKKRIAVASGGVTAETGHHDRARTAEAHYSGADGSVAANTPVHVEGPAYSLDAGRYLFHVEENRLELQGGVIARSLGNGHAPAGGTR